MKKTLLSLSSLALAMMLSGCSTANDMVTATNQPTSTVQATTAPMITVVPSITEDMNTMDGTTGMNGANGTDGVMPGNTIIPESTGVTSMDKAKRVIEQIEDELERLSEVDDAEVVIAGNKAAVALEFDDQYKGGVDDRLRKIVQERIDSVISGISTVAITADQTIMDAVESLGDRLDTIADMTTLQGDLEAIIRKINGTNA